MVSTGATGADAPVNLGQWVHAPVKSCQILHPSIEISNQVTDQLYSNFTENKDVSFLLASPLSFFRLITSPLLHEKKVYVPYFHL